MSIDSSRQEREDPENRNACRYSYDLTTFSVSVTIWLAAQRKYGTPGSR